jgi:hypothetical protein
MKLCAFVVKVVRHDQQQQNKEGETMFNTKCNIFFFCLLFCFILVLVLVGL